MDLTMNPVLLVSIINTKLRNQYTSLHDLCEDLDLHYDDLQAVLNRSHYVYDEDQNQIRKGV